MGDLLIHVFATGSDHEAHQGNARRFKISVDPTPAGWTKVLEFRAFRTQQPGTVPVFVSETGGGPVFPGCNPHRFRVAYDSGVPTGWTRDSLIFYAYPSPQPGTVPHYVFERGGGDPAAGDPARCEITTNPCPSIGWGTKIVFYATPSEDANRMPIHVFMAGDDNRAHQGDPCRGNVSLDGVGPSHSGWTKVMEFKAFRAPVEGTVPYFVSETGGGPTHPGCNPHRFRIHTDSGIPTGWTRDTFTFHAYPRQVPGTIPFYVMERGGGDPAAGDPARCFISIDPNPLPGWYVKSTFFAYPSFNPALATIYVFLTGDDPNAHLGDPKRFRFALEGTNEPNSGWRRVTAFKAYTSPVPGTQQFFVSEAGGGQIRPGGDPHRFRVSTDSGVPTGWTRDVFSFWAYMTPMAGTTPFHVMERGGGDPALGDPARCEITQATTPTPGWHIKHKFYSYPYPDIY